MDLKTKTAARFLALIVSVCIGRVDLKKVAWPAISAVVKVSVCIGRVDLKIEIREITDEEIVSVCIGRVDLKDLEVTTDGREQVSVCIGRVDLKA